MIHFLLLLLLLTGCARAPSAPSLASVNIVDQSGMTQTIGSKERLKKFSQVDFLKPQPYQKVLRVFTPGSDGAIPAVVTSYYPSGQIKQSLCILSGRAHGPYREWHENGALKIEASVVGGSPQLGMAAERTWIFNGPCKAFSDQGRLLASMTYDRGLLEGDAEFWNEEGVLVKKFSYERGALSRRAMYYYDSGVLQLTISYKKGLQDGLFESFRSDAVRIAEEYYEGGHLIKGSYVYPEAGVFQGSGFRYVEGEGGFRLEEVRGGLLAGEVRLYQKGRLVQSYSHNNGVKEGIESFWNASGVLYLEVPYKEGRIQGEVITRYSDGALQSRREMSNNCKNGLFRAWYPGGEIMMIEEYNDDNLLSGTYYKCGSAVPVSKVEEGAGLAMIFDCQGQLERKIVYKDGKPH